MNSAILMEYLPDVRLSTRIGAERLGHQRPQVLECTADQPAARAWTSTLPSAVASTGPASTAARAVGGQLAEQRVLAAATDDVHGLILLTAELLGVVDASRVRLGQALEDAAGELGRRSSGPASPPVDAQSARSGSACRPAAADSGAFGVERRHRCVDRRGRLASSVGSSTVCPSRCQVRIDSLQQPHAHHVAQVADPAVDPALVGEVGLPAVVGEHRLVQLDTDQRPGAGRDVRGAAARSSARRPRPTRCRATRPPPPSIGAPAPDRPAATSAAACRSSRPASTSGGNSERGSPSLSISSAFHVAAGDVEQPGGRGVGALGALLAGQPEAEQIGDHAAAPVSASTAARRLLDGQLVQGVERQELQAVAAYSAP